MATNDIYDDGNAPENGQQIGVTLNKILGAINLAGAAATVWGTITGTLADQTDLQSALDAKIPLSQKGVANGVATLNASVQVVEPALTALEPEPGGTLASAFDGTGNISAATVTGEGSGLTGVVAVQATWAEFADAGSTMSLASLFDGSGGDVAVAQNALVANDANALQGFLYTDFIMVGASYSAIMSGTAYTLTGSFANVVGGTTSPSITIAAAGDYLISVDVSTSLVGATTVTGQSADIKLRRTNNTAADIGTQRQQPLPSATAGTFSGPSISIVQFPYTAGAGDIVTVQALITGALGAGSVVINNAHIVATRV